MNLNQLIGRQSTLIFILLGICLPFVNGCTQKTEMEEPIRPVQTIVVAEQSTSTQFTFPGEVKARHEFRMAFRAPGKIATRMVEIGQNVQPGQVLAQLDTQDYLLQNQQAQAQLQATETEHQQAQTTWKRTIKLVEDHFVSQAELDRVATLHIAAKARLAQAKSQAQIAQNQLQYTTLTSDTAAIVSGIEVEAGSVVTAGQTIIRLAKPGEKEVAIGVPEDKLAWIKKAAQDNLLQVELWSQPGHFYAGHLREIAPMADPTSKLYTLRISFSGAPEDVKLGMTASVLAKSKANAQILIPLTALFQEHPQLATATSNSPPGASDAQTPPNPSFASQVWSLQGDPSQAIATVTATPITIAGFLNDKAVVSGGLKPGDRIVTAGAHLVRAGQKVKPLEMVPHE